MVSLELNSANFALEPACEPLHNFSDSPFALPTYRALPYAGVTPSTLAKGSSHFPIPLTGSIDLSLPPVGPRARKSEQRAIVSMPEAPMHENGCSILGKDDIWFSRKVLRMKAVPKAARKQCLPNPDLQSGVRSTDSRHHLAPLLRGYHIRRHGRSGSGKLSEHRLAHVSGDCPNDGNHHSVAELPVRLRVGNGYLERR